MNLQLFPFTLHTLFVQPPKVTKWDRKCQGWCCFNVLLCDNSHNIAEQSFSSLFFDTICLLFVGPCTVVYKFGHGLHNKKAGCFITLSVTVHCPLPQDRPNWTYKFSAFSHEICPVIVGRRIPFPANESDRSSIFLTQRSHWLSVNRLPLPPTLQLITRLLHRCAWLVELSKGRYRVTHASVWNSFGHNLVCFFPFNPLLSTPSLTYKTALLYCECLFAVSVTSDIYNRITKKFACGCPNWYYRYWNLPGWCSLIFCCFNNQFE